MLDIARLRDVLGRLDAAERLRLLRGDQLQRWLRGQAIRVETYTGLLPELSVDPAALLDLIANEAVLRRAHGEQPSCAEYLERFPALAEPLRRHFDTSHAWSDSLVEQLAQSALLSAQSAGAASRTQVIAPSDDLAATVTAPPPTDNDVTAHAGPAQGLPRISGRTLSIPGYEIIRELGRGGMGVVYLARQTSLKRQVALKMILGGGHTSPEMVRRFSAEAEAVARLQHPNIVQVFEIGQHDGLPYFSLEYVDGGSLRERMRAGPMPPRQVAELVETLARAVHHAHQQGIIHRDLKPHNILLRQDGTPVITDFGLAKRQDSDSALTMSGMVMGTAAYMSPEQASGKVRDIGPSTDIYALGAILYELLAEQPPFNDETFEATLLKVMHDQPLPPSRLRPEVPAELEAVCLKCLEKDVQARFTTAAELAEEMYRFRMGQTVQTAPLNAGFWLNLWAQRAGFQLLEPVGRGARTEVYRARQVRLQREVALKIIRGDASDRRELLDRLEAQAVAGGAAVRQLRQANPYSVPMVEIYDLGERDGLGYCAMEFLENGSLAQRIVGTPWPIRQAVELVVKVARALSFAHTTGFAHGNLKPANILLTADGSPKLTDFISAPLTGVKSGKATGRAQDIHALGRILHALLTGQLSAEATTLEPLSRLRPEVPSELETLCLRCLAAVGSRLDRLASHDDKGPALRAFERLGDLADDLESFLATHRRETSELPAALIPGFDLIEALGRGRIGPVFKARVSGSDRIVALQWFEPRGHVDQEQRRYFRAALEAERLLDHPYIRKIEEIGEKAQRLYVVTEYLPGGSLTQRLASGSIALDDAVWLVEHLAEAIHYAHQRGVFHGDLSPDKVLFSADGIPKIGDFRLVGAVQRHLVPHSGPLDVTLETRPGYKPPEYLQRKPLEATPAADVYSLGAILFTLLTGQAPQVAVESQSFSRDAGQINLNMADELASPARLVKDIPKSLDRICRRALAWHPRKRHASAAALARDLRRFWESLPGHRPAHQGWFSSLTRWLGS